MIARNFTVPIALLFFAIAAGNNGGTLFAQSGTTPDGVTKAPVTEEKPDPLKRRISDKEKRDQNKELKRELKGSYKTWVDQDVRWIITDQELQAFRSMSNDEERDQFIEAFWQRRNPNPDSPDNEFREQHYQRIAYANEHFAAGKPGWRTDRGHIYIAYGKPDSIDSHPSGGNYERPMEEGGGNTSTFPFEVWHYRYLEGVGDNIDIEFVDTCMCGDFHMTIDRSEKDALKHTPGAGQTLYEQTGQAGRSLQWRRSRATRRRPHVPDEPEQAVRSPRPLRQAHGPSRHQVQGYGGLHGYLQDPHRSALSL